MTWNEEAPSSAVDRALALLTLVAEKGPIGVKAAARETGVAPSTVHRIFATLCRHGYLAQAGDRRYRPGPRLHGARTVPALPDLKREAQPFLQELSARVNETVHLLALVGTDVRLVDGVECDRDLRVGLRIGAQFPAHATAGGRAILSEIEPNAVLARYPDSVPDLSAHPTISKSELLYESGVERAHAWLNVDGPELGMSIISAASSVRREPFSAISIALPTARFRASDTRLLVLELLNVTRRAREALDGSA